MGIATTEDVGSRGNLCSIANSLGNLVKVLTIFLVALAISPTVKLPFSTLSEGALPFL